MTRQHQDNVVTMVGIGTYYRIERDFRTDDDQTYRLIVESGPTANVLREETFPDGEALLALKRFVDDMIARVYAEIEFEFASNSR